MAATSLTMLRSVWFLETESAHLPVFLHIRTTNLPGPSSIMRSEQAQQRRFERRHNKHECKCGDDVHDRAPVRQGHVSVSPFTPFEVACEPFVGQLCLLSALTQGRYASSLCLCHCLCQQGLAGTGQSPGRDSQAVCLTSSGRVPVFLCVSLVSQQHISHLFA